MPCKNSICGHSAYDHDYNPDWKTREQCKHKNEKYQRCNCREFIK